MINFNKTFKEIAKMEFTQYGFKCKGNNFVRVVDDVIQNFNLNLSHSGWSCTVDFGIVPLCYPIEKRNITEGLGAYMLRMFEDNMQWWEFDRKSEISIVNCINELVEYIHKYIIPFFERGRNCSNAYHVICSFEKSISSPFNNSVHMDDYLKYCMALKIGNYDAALLHLRAIEQQWVDAYNEMNDRGYMTKEYEEKNKMGLEKYRKEIEMVANRDEQSIQEFTRCNEAHSIANLKGVYKNS